MTEGTATIDEMRGRKQQASDREQTGMQPRRLMHEKGTNNHQQRSGQIQRECCAPTMCAIGGTNHGGTKRERQRNRPGVERM